MKSGTARLTEMMIGLVASTACARPSETALLPDYVAPADVARVAANCRGRRLAKCFITADEARRAKEFENAAFVYDAMCRVDKELTGWGIGYGLLIGRPADRDQEFALYFLDLYCDAKDPMACTILGFWYTNDTNYDWRGKLRFGCESKVEAACERLEQVAAGKVEAGAWMEATTF